MRRVFAIGLLGLFGCATSLSSHGISSTKDATVAVYFDQLNLDTHGGKLASQYPGFVHEVFSDAYREVFLVDRLHRVEHAGADLVASIKLTQTDEVFYVGLRLEAEVMSRDGSTLYQGVAEESSWNWAGNQGDHSRAVRNVVTPLLGRMFKDAAVNAYLEAPRPAYAEAFSRAPPPPPPPPAPPPPRRIAPPPPPVVRAPRPAPVAPEKPMRSIVAVFDLEGEGIRLRAARRRRLHDYLTTRVAATGRFEVVPSDDVRRSVQEAKAESYKECYDESCQIEIGKELAAQKTMAVKILRLGKGCTAMLKLYDLSKATLEAASSADGSCNDEGIAKSLNQALIDL